MTTEKLETERRKFEQPPNGAEANGAHSMGRGTHLAERLSEMQLGTKGGVQGESLEMGEREGKGDLLTGDQLTETSSSGQPTELLADLPAELKFDARFAAIKVEPKDDDERSSPNFPRNLHNAAELFVHIGHASCARTLHASASKLLEILAAGPDGASCHSIGRGAICWSCGYAGLPANREAVAEKGPTPAAVCAKCGETEQTNFLAVTQPGQGVVPWIELN